ncbi:MAG: amino acid adenylation domain-containing protein [Cytophagales bacterium]|nr:amino acid adenylation domain-containing protein [Cytophagales bacterium]
MEKYTGLEIAVIGMAGRFPKAENIEQYWDNLKNGRDCISKFSTEEILEEGESADAIKNAAYVKAGAYLESKAYFDSDFFGYRPDEAELMDPQIRIFHECCWQALEDSGYSSPNDKNIVGLFAAGSPNVNWELHSYSKNREGLVNDFSAHHLRNITFLSSLISYKLNLKGPSIFIQTACSSSLVSIHKACSSLLLGECTMALAGGVTIHNFSKKGYIHQVGMIQSKDGKCRPFDASSSGTVGGEGVGVVVLKKLKDAIRDRDHIHAVIKGTGINNDGHDKVGYTAPSVKGQSVAIKRAHKMARVSSDSISYVEAHGTATELGDPIEIEALNEAFGKSSSKYCAIGSVKSNIGHLDSAAGVAGFIKTILAIKNKQIPASLYFKEPNPKINFTDGPFFVNHTLKDWSNNSGPLRAGVSSFGIGGTNAHVVLEEPPVMEPSTPARDYHLILLSAKTQSSLERNVSQFTAHLKNNTDSEVQDIAYTLQKGRFHFKHRKMLVCENRNDAINILSDSQSIEQRTLDTQEDLQNVVFMFSGQGSQYVDMCKGLYLKEKVFRDKVEECLEIAHLYFEGNLRSVLFADQGDDSGATSNINDTQYAQPLLFIIEYSMAHLLMKWGVRPDYMIGHSIGEYVAACVSGVFTLHEALRLVVRRGELMSKAKRGSMLSINASEEQIKPLLDETENIDLAVINSGTSLVVSGEKTDLDKFEEQVLSQGYTCKKLHTSHAFHSYMMDEILDEFEQELSMVEINETAIPCISNINGEIITYEEIRKPSYWSRHLRSTVHFLKGIETLKQKGRAVFIELGPGRSLSNYVEDAISSSEAYHVVNTVRQPRQKVNDQKYLIEKVGRLWLNGIKIDWDNYYIDEKRRRLALPAYSFEKNSYTANVDAKKLLTGNGHETHQTPNHRNDDYIYTSSWKRSISPNGIAIPLEDESCIVVISGDENFSEPLIRDLASSGQKVIEVRPGESFEKTEDHVFKVNILDASDLWNHLSKSEGLVINNVIYCAALSELAESHRYEDLEENFELGYMGLSYLAKSITQIPQTKKINLTVINNHIADVTEDDEINPLKATILGPAKVIPSEIQDINCKVIDIPYPFQSETSLNGYLPKVINEIFYDSNAAFIAYRYKERWVQSFEALPENEQTASAIKIVENGTYLITGGFGGMGFTIAKDLVNQYKAHILLVHRSKFPERKEWNDWLLNNEKEEPTSIRIREILEMEEAGGQVDLYQVDVAEEDQVQNLTIKIKEEYPKLDGLIWAAGEIDAGGIILNREKENFTKYTASKVQSLLLFEKYLGFESLDFIALFSSIGNVFYQSKFGEVAYNASNEFLESYSLFAQKKMNVHAFTINWCDWLDVGMTVKAKKKREETKNIHQIDVETSQGISPKEGAVCFHKCLQSKVPVNIIYKGDLNAAIKTHESKYKKIVESLTTSSEPVTEPIEEVSLEKTLIAIFSQFFGKKGVTANDDFFELGGDSLKGMTLVARINQKVGTQLSIGDLYKHTTIRELTDKLSDDIGEQVTEHDIPKAADQAHYVLSSAQKRMYFLQTLDEQSTAYNEVHALKLSGSIDKEKLEMTFQKLILRHESFRTFFETLDKEPVQKVKDEVDFKVDYFEQGTDSPEESISKFIRPFDLSIAPLIRVGLMELSADEHLLVLDAHHIVMDAVSQSIIINDFMALYNDEPLSELKLTYKDFAEWNHSEEQQGKLEKQKEFWIKEFSKDLEPIELPTDFERPSVNKNEGNTVEFSLDRNETTSLKSLAEEEGATMFMVMLSLYNVLLSKLSNQEDIVVGTSVAGRHQHADLEEMVGMFVSALPMRNYPQGELSFRKFLASVKSRVLDGLENQDYPYEKLIDAINVERDLGRNPLFDVLFDFHNFKEPELKIPNLELAPFDFERGSSRFDLILTAVERDGQIFLRMGYSSVLFREESVIKFVTYFKNVVAAIIEDVDIKISDIEILDDREQQHLLYDFNQTEVAYNKEQTVLALFKNQVKENPHNKAILCGDQEITYEALDLLSDNIALYLQHEKEVGKGDLVGVQLDRNEHLVPCIIAILKLGAAYIPIDASYPEDYVTTIAQDAGLKVMVTKERYQEVPCAIISDFINPDKSPEALVSDKKLPDVEIKGSDLAYVIYTSGSTGKPKGVMIEHSSLMNYVSWASKYYLSGEAATFGLYTSISFDLTVTSIFTPLITGNSIVMYPGDDNGSPVEEIFRDGQVEIMKLTPSHLKILRDLDFEVLESSKLRKLIVGGEELETPLARAIYDRFDGKVEIYNEYGPTEATVGCMIHRFTPEESLSTVPIGGPVNNTQVYILDQYLHPVTAGTQGDLYVSGSGVARGYLSNEKLTEERFMANPFIEGAIMYKTGDIAQMSVDGNVLYKGRTDDQVKVRGHRIELNEIAHQLSTYDQIDESIVLGKDKGEEGDKYLVGYYLSDSEIPADSLINHLSASLPEYMVPSFFVHLREWPLTTNGKLDKKSLPDPEQIDQEDFEPPVTPEEKIVAKAWSEVLSVDPVSINDTFFSLGGDSIKSILINSRIRRAGYEMSVKDLFTDQTVKKLSKKLKPLTSVIDQSEVKGSSSLTPIQQWFFTRSLEHKHHYNQSVMLHFAEGISEENVNSIFQLIQKHHDSLRMVFREEKDILVQENLGADVPLSMEAHDLKASEDISTSLLNICHKIESSINLEEGPLMKIGLFQMAEGSRLFITIHHLIVDGVSWRILLEDIESLYQKISRKEPLTLPKKTSSFLSWSEQLSIYMKTDAFYEAKAFWNDFESLKVEPLLRDNEHGTNTGKHRKFASFTLDQKQTAELLTNVHQSFGTQINDLLLAALLLSVERQYGNKTIQVDLENHGRKEIPNVDFSRTVGWFTVIYPVILGKVDGDLSHLIKSVKEGLRNIPNDGFDYPLTKHFVSDFRAIEENSQSGSQVLFNYLGQFDSDTENRSYSIIREEKRKNASNTEVLSDYDWDISGSVISGKLGMTLAYSSEQYSEASITAFVNSYKEKLEEIIAYCGTYDKQELTQSDLTYKGISNTEFQNLQRRYDFSDIYPLSPMQEGILFHSVLDTEEGYYFGQTTGTIKGKLDVGIMERSMNFLISRYDILRTVFLHKNYDRPIQVVLKEQKIDFTYADISNDIKERSEEEVIAKYRQKDKNRKFDLSNDVLMRLTVMKVAEDEFSLIWSHHHILMDRWCIGIIINEFFTIYLSYVEDKEITLPRSNPYAGYIKWLQERNQEASAEYWSNYLASYESVSVLPQKETTSVEALPYLHKTRQLVLSQEQTSLFHKVAQGYGITANTLFQFAWGYLLTKYNNVNDIVFGTVVSGRPAEIEGIENMVGLFINTIPVRIKYDPNSKIGDLLKDMQEHALEGEGHHYHPLSEIQSLSGLGRNLFNHIITFENIPISQEINVSGKKISNPFEISNSTYSVQTNYDFNLTVTPTDQFEVKFTYNGNVFEDELVNYVSAHLKNIIYSIIRNPDTLVKNVSLYDDQEYVSIRENFSKDLNNAFDIAPIQKRLSDSFQKYSENCAIEYNGRSFTYAQIENEVNKVSNAILDYNIVEHTNIGLLLEDRHWLISSMLGILKSRMSFVPLEVLMPMERLSSMVDHTGTKYIITDQKPEQYEQLDSLNDGITWITIDEIEKQNEKPVQHKNNYQLDDPIYIYFTSGSTGTPKGILGQNQGLVHFVDWYLIEFEGVEQARFSQFSNPGFDAILKDIFVPLCSGGTVCIPDESVVANSRKLKEWISSERINIIHCVPSFFKLIQQGGIEKNIFSDLNYLFLSGEKIHLSELKHWYEIFGDRVQLVNLYGATETTIIKSFHLIQPEDITKEHAAVEATMGAQMMLLDNTLLNPCPHGAIGEVYVRTPYRTLGYLDQEKTKASFLPNPFSKDTDDLIYRTGDLGRINDNGEFEILGRIDNQVKINGVRIELDDIKENILKHPAIKEAVVSTIEDIDGEKILCGYFVSDESVDLDELRLFLNGNLPYSMIPPHFIQLDKIPLSPNGKTDRKALPRPDFSATEGGLSPVNESESKLVSIWADVLKLEKNQIGTDRSFFEIGGHSIKIFHLINRIYEEFSVRLNMIDIFQNTSIIEMSNLILEHKQKDGTQISKVEKKEFYPASPAQERMYYQHLLHNENTSFNISMPVEIKGEIDEDTLNASFQKLVNRHDNLRTSFILLDEGVIQKVNQDFTFNLEIIDGNKFNSVEEAFKHFIRPFDLSGKSMMRCGLLKSKDGNFLFVDIHHIISDRISLNVLINDFKNFYFGEKITPLEFQYKDYANWINSIKGKLSQQKDFWKQKLSGEIVRTDLPTIQSRNIANTQLVDYKQFDITDQFLRDIKKFAVKTNVSDFMVFLSAYYILLHKMSGNSDIIIGTEAHGRTQTAWKDIVGTFVNVIPLRISVDPENFYFDFLSEVKDCVLQAFDNQDIQFDQMVGMVNESHAELSRNPIFDHYFSFSNAIDHTEELGKLKFVPFSVGKQIKGEYEFVIKVDEIDEKINVAFVYSSELYDDENIELLMGYYRNILHVISNDPQQVIEEIELEEDFQDQTI